MSPGTRYFLVGSALVIVVVFGVGLVAYYNGDLPLRLSTEGPAELAYVPQDASGVGYANVRAILNSDFCKKLQASIPTGEGRDALESETGVDIEHDVDEVVSATGAAGSVQAGSLVLVRGHFDTDRITKAATGHGAKAEDYRGKHLLVLADGAASAPAPGAVGPAGQAPSQTSIAFLEPSLLALGSASAVKRAIDTAASRDDVTKNADLMKLVAEVDHDDSAWIVGRTDTLADNAGLPPQVKSALPMVQWFAAKATLTDSVTGRIYVEAKDQQSGDQLRAVINGALGAAKLMAGSDPKVGATLNSLQATGTGKSVELGFSLPSTILDSVHGMLPGAPPVQHAPAATPLRN